MGFLSTLALTLALTAGPVPAVDTAAAPYADPATELLVARARARRVRQDSSVTDYTANLLYRLTLGQSRRKWGVPVPVSAEEQVARVAWQRRNDLKVEVLGRRTRSRTGDRGTASIFDSPWFVPRDVDDSVRIVGLDFPASGALHPLAEGADLWYRYQILDSLRVDGPGGGVRLVRVEVVPRRGGRALVAGRLWLDAETAETVRFAFRYVGAVRWLAPEGTAKRDSSRAARNSRLFGRFATLELDLEYGRQDGRHWMPSRQTISGRVTLPLGEGTTVPFQVVTTFDDYVINSNAPIAFRGPMPGPREPGASRARRDSLRTAWEQSGGRVWGGRTQRWDAEGQLPGGRFEIVRPSNDSLRRFRGWTDTLALAPRPADAARVAETAAELEQLVAALPNEIAEQRRSGFGYERIEDAFRFNRVQGNTVGLGWQQRVGAFSTLAATGRYGFGDDRPTGRLALVRDAPGGRLTLFAARDVQSVDPVSSGRGLSATVNAVFAAHDYADYALVTGGGASFETGLGGALDLTVSASVQEERSVAATSRSGVNDFFGGSGEFQPGNPAVTEGTFVRGGLGLRRSDGARWSVQTELVQGAGATVGRAWGDLRLDRGRHRGLTLRLRAGAQTGDSLPQTQWRLGGPNTVRGFAYGAEQGRGFWSAQLDVAPFPWPIRPVFFADAGQARDLDALFSGRVRTGGGVGLALYSRTLRTGFLRVDASRPFETGGKWRVDLTVGAVR